MALSIPVPMPGIGDGAKLELTSVGLVRRTKKAKKLDAAMQQPLKRDPGFPFEAPSGFRFGKKMSHHTEPQGFRSCGSDTKRTRIPRTGWFEPHRNGRIKRNIHLQSL